MAVYGATLVVFERKVVSEIRGLLAVAIGPSAKRLAGPGIE
jgi:hypothetical protein